MNTSLPPDVAALAVAVSGLLALPTQGWTVGQLQEQIVAVTPLLGRLDGWLRDREGQLHTLAAGQVPTEDGGTRTAAGWLAEVRCDTASAAGGRLRTSTLLREHLPLVADAVVDGVLTVAQAHVLTRLIGKIDADVLVETQDAIITVAAGRDPAAVGAWVADRIATYCEPALEADDRNSSERRYLQTRREADGALRGSFLLSREDSEAFVTALEPLARKQGNDDRRTAGQRRADSLVEVCAQVLRHGALGDAGGQRPQLSYLLPAAWAATQAAKEACRDCGPRCAEHRSVGFAESVLADLPGQPGRTAAAGCARAAWSGPQTRGRIESILCDARISRVLLDGRGQVRGLEHLTDDVTPMQRRMLAARDGGCVARGCTRPPAVCDAHHLLHRADGGPTNVDNLALLCRRHHVLWHKGKIDHGDLTIPWHDTARGDVGLSPEPMPSLHHGPPHRAA